VENVRCVLHGVELVRRLIRGAHGGFFDVKITAEFLNDAWHGGHRQSDDKIQIVCGARDAPIVARHRAGKIIGHSCPVQPAQTIREQFLFIHAARASLRRA
jgi:hypothetical protein